MDGNRLNGRTDGSSPFDGLRQGSSVEATTVQEPPATTEAAEPDIIIRSDPETKKEDTGNLPAFYLPEERTEENGMIRRHI